MWPTLVTPRSWKERTALRPGWGWGRGRPRRAAARVRTRVRVTATTGDAAGDAARNQQPAAARHVPVPDGSRQGHTEQDTDERGRRPEGATVPTPSAASQPLGTWPERHREPGSGSPGSGRPASSRGEGDGRAWPLREPKSGQLGKEPRPLGPLHPDGCHHRERFSSASGGLHSPKGF